MRIASFHAVARGAALCLAISVLPEFVSAQGRLAQDFTTDDLIVIGIPVPSDQANHLTTLNAWRQRALTCLQQLPGTGTTADDYDVIRHGSRFRLQFGYPVEDLLDELSDARLTGAFDHGRANESKSMGNAGVRQRIAAEVLSRPALASRHGEASYDSALMTLVLTFDRDEVVSGFTAARDAVGPSTEYGQRCDAARAAMTGPSELLDFETSLELLDVATYMNGRLQINWLTTPLLVRYNSQGLSGFDPVNFSGSGLPLQALAQAAFEKNEGAILTDIETNLATLAPSDVESVIKTRYWIAMLQMAWDDHTAALPKFQQVVNVGTGHLWEGHSMIRMGECEKNLGNDLEAAIHYLTAKNTYPQHPEITQLADERFDYLSLHGRIDPQQTVMEYRTRQNGRRTAMATDSLQDGGEK